MKKKGVGMVITIILVAVCGWVAIVSFVIKPDMVAGAALSVCGGGAIGLAIAYLMRRWWFKRIPIGKGPDLERVTSYKIYPLGTSFQTVRYGYLYVCAGEDLKGNTFVESDLSGRLVIGEPLPPGKEINELIYGSVRAATKVDQRGRGILGWPLVDVKKKYYCWLQDTIKPKQRR
ncbi:hypothetical protein ES703_10298 [subsurface metagenome]